MIFKSLQANILRDKNMKSFPNTSLRQLAQRITQALGSPEQHAREVADHLVDANLAGHDSHGIVRLPQYARHVADGDIDPIADPLVVRDDGPFVLMEARRSWGQVAARAAVEIAAQRARGDGFACVGLAHAPHIGRVGVYPLRLAEQGLIAQAWCNCSGAARVAPWGGTTGKLATNPIALAFPSRGEPILMDITTSVVAEGKVRIAKNAGKSVPDGWLLDKLGQPTTHPADLYEGGTILPLGGTAFGHKGFALALMADLLAGVLIGSGCGLMPGTRNANGMLLIVIDPDRWGQREEWATRLDEYVNYIRNTPTRPGVDEILLPGEPERRTTQDRIANGIPVDDGTWEQIAELADRLGVDVTDDVTR
jgi:uncharacterized oxidoreductase